MIAAPSLPMFESQTKSQEISATRSNFVLCDSLCHCKRSSKTFKRIAVDSQSPIRHRNRIDNRSCTNIAASNRSGQACGHHLQLATCNVSVHPLKFSKQSLHTVLTVYNTLTACHCRENGALSHGPRWDHQNLTTTHPHKVAFVHEDMLQRLQGHVLDGILYRFVAPIQVIAYCLHCEGHKEASKNCSHCLTI